MQKIQFSKSNAIDFNEAATKICAVYNQISDEQLDKNLLLTGVSVAFGYDNYEELLAVNKSQRNFYKFSMANTSHMRAISNKLASSINIDINKLLASVTLVELAVMNFHNVKKFEKFYTVFCFDVEKDASEVFYSKYKYAGLMTREAIKYELFALLYPECASILKKKFNINEGDALMFPVGSHWWRVADHIRPENIGYELLRPCSFVFVEFRENEVVREIMHPIFNPYDISEIVDGCLLGFGIEELVDEIDEFECDRSIFYVHQRLKTLKNLDLVDNVYFVWEEMDLYRFSKSPFSLLKDFFVLSDSEPFDIYEL